MVDEIPEEEETWMDKIEGSLEGVSAWTGIPVEWLKRVIGLGALGGVAYVILKLVFGRD